MEVFENFRDLTIDAYQLDPANYVTAPGLAWDCCLKYTGVKLELIDNIAVLDMFCNAIRGRVSTVCSLKYAQANNK